MLLSCDMYNTSMPLAKSMSLTTSHSVLTLHYTSPIMIQHISATSTTTAPGRGPLALATKHELVKLQLRLSPLAHVARLV